MKEIAVHPWMSMKHLEKKLNINFEKIRNYSKFSKFKVLVLNYIASQLPQKEIMLLGKVFLEIDKNKDGYLTVEELSAFFEQHDNHPAYEDIREIIRYFPNKSGTWTSITTAGSPTISSFRPASPNLPPTAESTCALPSTTSTSTTMGK